MARIWSEQEKLSCWLRVEGLALEGLAQAGLVPKAAAEDYAKRAKFEIDRVQELELEVKHDVIAFLTNVAEHVGPSSRFVHRGLTSNDLLDTALSIQLRKAGDLILSGIDQLKASIAQKANEFRKTPCIGRSHGIHAEPTTFGLKLAGWYAELLRREAALRAALDSVCVVKIAGAVGTYGNVPPEVEAYVAAQLGFPTEDVASQVVPRDRHAEFLSSLALLASSVERWCVEIRHLQRTEVGEAFEPFGSGQKGSSAMPHKKNPILTENLTGLARLVRGYAAACLENVPLWHERDISHSSVERVALPDACILSDFLLHRFDSVVSGLVVDTDRMMENLRASNGMVFSGTLLLALVDSEMSREEAYALVQKYAKECWQSKRSFEELIRADKRITSLIDEKKLSEVFSLERHFAHVDTIFARVFDKRNCA
ncbi:MAG: adenylosuccinate lyase [Bdellovibrionales bacterium]|nr:adenylosuccinate lyase [Bdellovibrionales bacterium]